MLPKTKPSHKKEELQKINEWITSGKITFGNKANIAELLWIDNHWLEEPKIPQNTNDIWFTVLLHEDVVPHLFFRDFPLEKIWLDRPNKKWITLDDSSLLIKESILPTRLINNTKLQPIRLSEIEIIQSYIQKAINLAKLLWGIDKEWNIIKSPIVYKWQIIYIKYTTKWELCFSFNKKSNSSIYLYPTHINWSQKTKAKSKQNNFFDKACARLNKLFEYQTR